MNKLKSMYIDSILKTYKFSQRFYVQYTSTAAKEAVKVSKTKDKATLAAIETADKWLEGKATKEECKAAAYAAYAAANAAYAAYAAANAANAANAAANAANAANAAANAAYADRNKFTENLHALLLKQIDNMHYLDRLMILGDDYGD